MKTKDGFVPCCRCGKKPLRIDEVGIFPSTSKKRKADLICGNLLCLIEEMIILEEGK